MIGAKVPGRVETMLVEEGSEVREGDPLAILEHHDLDAQLESRRAMVARSKAELEEVRADLDLKKIQAERHVRLRGQGQISEEEKEQAVAAYRMTRAKAAALEAAIRLQESMVAEVEATIADMNILAPFDGTVIEKAAEVGETITPGGMGAASGRGSVVTLADLKALEVETDVAEGQLAKIAVGQPAEVAVAAVPDKRYRGRLRQIIPMGDRTRGQVKVKVQVLDADERLFPELVCTVHFLPDESLNNPAAGQAFLYVPRAAIVEQGGLTYAWVVDDKPSVRRRRVEIAATDDDPIRVESGLAPGEKVVLRPSKDLQDGQLVATGD
jgi:RND family efflux transporter MFP subunit